jgi:hypothetical protein
MRSRLTSGGKSSSSGRDKGIDTTVSWRHMGVVRHM